MRYCALGGVAEKPLSGRVWYRRLGRSGRGVSCEGVRVVVGQGELCNLRWLFRRLVKACMGSE
jgi:hypothetical protein